MEIDKQKCYPRDPFAVEPLPRAHYYPSPERKLTRDQKRTAISPQRQPDKEKATSESRNIEENRLSPMDEIFLRNTNLYHPRMMSHYTCTEADHDEKFDESWPSSERPSSMNLTGLEESPMNMEKFQATIDRFTDLKKTLAFPDHVSPGTSPELSRRAGLGMAQKEAQKKAFGKTGTQMKSQIPVRDKSRSKERSGEIKETMKKQEDSGGGSVLQRYIERFRNSAPLSREERERQKENRSEDFWWLSAGSQSAPHQAPSTSSASKEKETGGKKDRRITPLTTVNLDKYSNLQKLTQNGYQKTGKVPASPGDLKTRDLQERAEKLLERSSSTVVSTEPAVSTEGLGSNTSGMSSLEEYPYRPKFAAFLDKEDQLGSISNPYNYKTDIPSQRPPPPPQARPEDDPLHQWRLRRRMEQAQEGAPKNVQSFGFLSKTEQQKRMDTQLEEFKRKLAGKDTATKTKSPAYQFTTIPSQEQMTEKEPQIASPVLQRRRPETETEVDPHLHLMCDLLPCPHRGKYVDLFGNLQTDQNSKELHRKDLPGDKGRQKEIPATRDTELDRDKDFDKDKWFDKELNLQVEDSERLSTKQRSDEFRNDKVDKESESTSKGKSKKDDRQYKQFLEAEKPDIEVSESDQSVNSDKTLQSGRSEKSDRSSTDKENKRKRKEKEKISRTDKDSIDLDKKGLRKRGKDTTGKPLSPIQVETSYNDQQKEFMQGSQRSKERDDRSRSKEARKDKLRPRHSSSPVRERKVVDEAIGQVVKNHLFSMSTSTVLSSVESLPPSHSVEGLPRVPEHTQEEPDAKQEEAETQITGEADSYESDGEFSDDHLLQMLRQQRAQYELQLRDIDAVLSKLEPS